MDSIVHVLHVGDKAEYRMLSHLLADIHYTDYRLSACLPGEDVLGKILAQDCDIILLDYHWGDDSVFRGQVAHDLLCSARAQGCEVPIVVMTDEMEAEVDREAIRAGASDYLIKGRIDSQLLERTIRYAIERKNAELRLAKLAHYDPLTNIPNRILFRDRLQHALQRAERRQQTLTLMYLDLDGFKQVNDKFGHDAGDELLRSCAQRLCDCMRKSDSVARIGGDEFTLLLENAQSTADIARIAEKVIAAISAPHHVGNHQVMAGCSIGIAVYPNAGKDADTLQRNADMAMYQAKQDETSSFRFFTEAMNVEARRQFLLESDLQHAVEQKKFHIRYQPRIDLFTGAVMGLKSHLHWYHPQRGWLDSEQFIQLAEDTGLIGDLGLWEMAQVTQDSAKWCLVQPSSNPVGINLSPRQMTDEKYLRQLEVQLNDLRLPVNAVEFEMAEKDLVEHSDTVRHFFEMPLAKKIGLTVKDFGEGLCAPKFLQQLPINRFALSVASLGSGKKATNHSTVPLLAALVSFALQLDKHVIATGIDNAEKLKIARQLGCQWGEGSICGGSMNIEQLLQGSTTKLVAAS